MGGCFRRGIPLGARCRATRCGCVAQRVPIEVVVFTHQPWIIKRPSLAYATQLSDRSQPFFKARLAPVSMATSSHLSCRNVAASLPSELPDNDGLRQEDEAARHHLKKRSLPRGPASFWGKRWTSTRPRAYRLRRAWDGSSGRSRKSNATGHCSSSAWRSLSRTC